MAKPRKPPPYPLSLIAEDIQSLIGFGIKVDTKPPRTRTNFGANGLTATIFNRKPSRRAFFEFETKRSNTPDFDRRVFVAHEDKQKITHIEEVSPLDLAFSNLMPGPDDVIHPIAPIVCSIHMFQTFDNAPLLILIDEKYDRVILAIGNMGERPIDFVPRAARGYRPDWYRDMKVRDDLPVYAPAPA